MPTLRILLVGPTPPPIGGTRVSFRHLVENLEARESVHVSVVETADIRNVSTLGKVAATIRVFAGILWQAPRVDVLTLHASTAATLTIGPFLYLVGKAFRKPTVLREFGGAFADDYFDCHRVVRWGLRKSALAMDLVLMQTNSMVEVFRTTTNARVEWFATSRPMSDDIRQRTGNSKPRFVFVGHVKPTKGIRELVAAANKLQSKYSFEVDIWGPLREGVVESELNTKCTRYRGVLPMEEVRQALDQYDVLVLPTYFHGEGYPGSIVEAFACGLPVITTDWRSIPELVNESNGILVKPRDINDLADALERLIESPEQVRELSGGALATARRFSVVRWSDIFVEYLYGLVDKDACSKAA